MKTYQIINGKLSSQSIPAPHLIDAEVGRMIRREVSLDDELKARRVGGEFEATVNAHIEKCVALGREQKLAAEALCAEWADRQQGEDESDAAFIKRIKL